MSEISAIAFMLVRTETKIITECIVGIVNFFSATTWLESNFVTDFFD